MVHVAVSVTIIEKNQHFTVRLGGAFINVDNFERP